MSAAFALFWGVIVLILGLCFVIWGPLLDQRLEAKRRLVIFPARFHGWVFISAAVALLVWGIVQLAD